MSKIFCFLGRSGSGKSTLANLLVETNNYKKVSLAEPLRREIWKLIGYKPNDYSQFKNSFLPKYNLTGRQLMQQFGESKKEEFGKDYWGLLWLQEVKRHKFVVCDDMRFPEEIQIAKTLKAEFIWCDYKEGNYPVDNHSSEKLANTILKSNLFKHGETIPYNKLNLCLNK